MPNPAAMLRGVKPEHAFALHQLRAEQTRLHRGIQRADDRIISLAVAWQAGDAEEAPKAVRPAPAPRAPIPPRAPRVAETPRPRPPIPEPAPEPPLDFAPIAFKPAPAPVEKAPEAREEEPVESMEITFGRVWLVRLGIVILLTGLVFLGNLAYQHIIPRLGPGAKLAIIYFAGFALGAAGIILERARESLRNYARVVLAGGCAAIYYATYAAYFVAPLRVIESPLVAGAALLGLAIAIGIAADRRKSETLALVALVLSYYTSGLNPVGTFTLFSSLLLSATGVYFLLRHRWVRLSAASLAGAYLSYWWCRHFGAGSTGAGSDLVASLGFLGGYWVLFTAGGFLAKADVWGGAARTQFLTANNAAFGLLAAAQIAAQRPGEAWAWALGFGVVLLALGRLARRVLAQGAVVDGAFFVQGIALTTLGLALKLTGQQLALALAAQSVLLLAGGGTIPLLRLGAAILTAGGASILALFGLVVSAEHAPVVAGFVALALVAVGWIYRRRSSLHDAESSPLVTGFVVVALTLGAGAMWKGAGYSSMITSMAVAAMVCAVLPRRLGLRELTLAGQGLLPVGAFLWVAEHASTAPRSALDPALLIFAGIALSLWWARQNRVNLSPDVRETLEGSSALFAAVVAVVWTHLSIPTPAEQWVAASVMGTVWLAAALGLRARFLSAAGFAFTFLAVVQFARFQAEAHWALALVPIAHVLSIAGLTRWAQRLGNEAVEIARPTMAFALGSAGVMSVFWTFAHIDRAWQALFIAAFGVSLSLAGALLRRPVASIVGFGLGAFAWVLAVGVYACAPTWQHFAVILLVPAIARAARKLWPEEPTCELAPVVTWAAMLGITVWVLRWCDLYAQRMSLTIIWTLLAAGFFAAGLLLRDRHYRLGGLGLLALSIGRVFFVDVWAFDQVFRILSFIVLGTVLLLVGYCYNRFEEKLRRWL